MSAIPRLTGWDRADIANTAYQAVDFMIGNYYDIERVSEYFAHGCIEDAVRFCLEKGLQTMLDMCDMDDDAPEKAPYPNVPVVRE